MKDKRRIRILVVDDHPVVRMGLGLALARNPGFEVVGEAIDGDSAIQAARDKSPDVVLLDIDLPGRNGLSVAEVLRSEMPDIKVLILSMFTSEGYVMQALKTGVQGCVPKESSMDEVARAVQSVSDGDVYFSEGVARMALGRMVRNGQTVPSPEDLTQREREVLLLRYGLEDGHSRSLIEVGELLNVSRETVRLAEKRAFNLLRNKPELKPFLELVNLP